MGSVLHGLDPPGRSDQKVSGQSQRASRHPQAKMASGDPAHASTQSFEAQESKRCFHAELSIEHFLRIANQHERNIFLVRPDRLLRGVKDDYLFDAGRLDLASASTQLSNVRIANRTVHEPPELQMDESGGVRDRDCSTSDGLQ